ncbi:MAG: dUTP diphosphatase [Acidimicrobiales bacterium]
MVSLKLKQLDPTLELPRYAKPGDAGMDLRASGDFEIPPAGGRAVIPTGIAIAVPEGYLAIVVPRSGLALRHGISLVNTPGIIDSGYRGELQVIVINTDPVKAFFVKHGDRIAQMVVQRYESVEVELVDDLDVSVRGSGGFGSSGLR